MSAYVVGSETISKIVHFLEREVMGPDNAGFDWKLQEYGYEFKFKAADRQRFGQDLLDMNIDAVNQRYEDQTEGETFIFSKPSTHVNPYQFLKSLNCLDGGDMIVLVKRNPDGPYRAYWYVSVTGYNSRTGATGHIEYRAVKSADTGKASFKHHDAVVLYDMLRRADEDDGILPG